MEAALELQTIGRTPHPAALPPLALPGPCYHLHYCSVSLGLPEDIRIIGRDSPGLVRACSPRHLTSAA